jgi:hypothetical protein
MGYNVVCMRRWAALLLVTVSCATAPHAAVEVAPATPRFEALSYGQGGVLLHVPPVPKNPAVHVVKTAEGVAMANGEKLLTPSYPAIDSFDVSPEGDLVAFSAKHGDNFDVALVATKGSEVRWMPGDPQDEVAVQWAPRGSKISYVIRARSGDVIRTLHIPTAAQLTTTFPYGRVHALAWEPRAERYAVAWESIDASDRIELMTYAGDDRKLLTPPAVKLDVSVEPVGGALVMRPTTMRYNEKLPLVIWQTAEPHAWSDARGRLQQSNRIAVAVIDHTPDDAFRAAVRDVAWLDSARSFVVDARTPDIESKSAGRIAAALKAHH